MPHGHSGSTEVVEQKCVSESKQRVILLPCGFATGWFYLVIKETKNKVRSLVEKPDKISVISANASNATSQLTNEEKRISIKSR
jgi:hypothetical protein